MSDSCQNRLRPVLRAGRGDARRVRRARSEVRREHGGASREMRQQLFDRRRRDAGLQGEGDERDGPRAPARPRGRAPAGRRRRRQARGQADRFRPSRRLRRRQARQGQDGARDVRGPGGRMERRRRRRVRARLPPAQLQVRQVQDEEAGRRGGRAVRARSDAAASPTPRRRVALTPIASPSPRGSNWRARSSTSRRTSSFPRPSPTRAQELDKLGVEVEVFDEKAMAKLGMGALLAVGQGSKRESRFVVMRWKGAKAKKSRAGRLHRQGRLLRFRRHLDQAGRRHGGHEGRHGGRRLRRRPHARARQAQGEGQRRRRDRPRREHAERRSLSARATS